jgi:rSAM/selenodomain-associated transferase 2
MLPVQSRVSYAPPVRLQNVSIVIPTLNEAGALAETIQRARANPEVCEIIVVDGGSTDGTPKVAAALGCTVLQSPPGRGTQMRRGADSARGDVVLLLHADTWLPPNAAAAAFQCLERPGVIAGGFWKRFRDAPFLLLGSRFKCAVRLWLGRRVAGDQGLFVRRDVLTQIGGVPDIPLMEEFELCRRLRRLGRIALADAVVLTSARRFTERGILRTYLRMWHVLIRYWLGTPPEKLRDLYSRR